MTARLFTVYGSGEPPGRLLPALLEAARTGEPVPLTDGRQPRDFTYVEDVAEGLLRLGASRGTPGEVVNLATGRSTRVRDFAEIAADVLGVPRRLLRFGELPTRSDETWHDRVPVERLRARTGWAPPTSVAEGVRRTAEWERRREP